MEWPQIRKYYHLTSVTEGLAVQSPLHTTLVRYVAIITWPFCVVSCLAHCAILTTLFSSPIVEAAELVAGLH